MKWDTLIFEKKENVAIITMNQPKTFNAFSINLGKDLTKAFEYCATDKQIRAIILTGAGPAFCSGGDLKSALEDVPTDPSEFYRQATKHLNRVITEIRLFPCPVIASINGPVAGAGMGLATACDLRIASEKAKFKQAYTSIGLAPDGAWTLFVPLLVGLSKAYEMAFLDPLLDAYQALEAGLVNQVVKKEDLAETSMELATRLASGPTHAFATIKQQFNDNLLFMLQSALEKERGGITNAAKSKDYLEGLEAFFAKRNPVFRGE